ncbi:hypothetical protein [Pontibacter fetidus]|uniref:Uncharacterized protein n=1 Tax=Pontibacter fetidus TaxID=2700082 RepID=A0A6B2H1U5_9BACT|nr:hypothetical protein [Pontibacter fetidus]NDK57075.1 hypothetical protein [Pontibacter fetidus]
MKRLKRIRKYHRLSKRNKEFLYEDSWHHNEFLYMDSFSQNETGIENLIVWTGPNPNGFRIKVSNIPNRISSNYFFVMTLPDYQVIGQINEEFITPIIINQIKKWCDINMKEIIKYSKGLTTTSKFLMKLKQV